MVANQNRQQVNSFGGNYDPFDTLSSGISKQQFARGLPPKRNF